MIDNNAIRSRFPSHIEDSNGGGLLLQWGLVMRGGCDMEMDYDIYLHQVRVHCNHISQCGGGCIHVERLAIRDMRWFI